MVRTTPYIAGGGEDEDLLRQIRDTTWIGSIFRSNTLLHCSWRNMPAGLVDCRLWLENLHGMPGNTCPRAQSEGLPHVANISILTTQGRGKRTRDIEILWTRSNSSFEHTQFLEAMCDGCTFGTHLQAANCRL